MNDMRCMQLQCFEVDHVYISNEPFFNQTPVMQLIKFCRLLAQHVDRFGEIDLLFVLHPLG